MMNYEDSRITFGSTYSLNMPEVGADIHVAKLDTHNTVMDQNFKAFSIIFDQ